MAFVARISDDEEMALRDLRAEARVLYICGLRPFMDFKTGVVGIKRRVSYQGFKELLEVTPDRGSAIGTVQSPTKSALRALLQLLERHGLVVKLEQRRRIDPMVFKLPLADYDGKNRLDEQRHTSVIGKTTYEATQSESKNKLIDQSDAGSSDEVSVIIQRHNEKGTKRHTSVLPFTTTTAKNISIAREAENRLASDWLPSIEVMTKLAGDEFVDPEFVDEYTTEFVMFWCRSGVTKGSWDAVFFRQCLEQWKRRRFSWCKR